MSVSIRVVQGIHVLKGLSIGGILWNRNWFAKYFRSKV